MLRFQRRKIPLAYVIYPILYLISLDDQFADHRTCFSLNQLGKPSYEVKDFQWWDNIYTKAAQSVSIGETASAVQPVAEKKEEPGKTVYSGLFVTGGTMEDERKELDRKSRVTSESDLYTVCGSRDLRKFKQHGKNARYVLLPRFLINISTSASC